MAPRDEPSQKPLLEKLGVRAGTRISVLGVEEPSFVEELERWGADVSKRRRKDSDMIVVGIRRLDDLTRLESLQTSIVRSGAIWVVYPKGRKDLPEAEVIRRGVATGMVDNKIVRFSDTHTALRFVIPLARR